MSGKAPGAFRTIGELSDDLNVPRHILRYWETRFTQLRPLKRAGQRRYYRPEDVALVQRIHHLLNQDGYTIKGVQTLLATEHKAPSRHGQSDSSKLRAVRDSLTRALADDR